MTHFVALFYVWAQISAPVAPRVETLANESWSPKLQFARVSAQGEPLALITHQNKQGGLFSGILGYFSVLFLGLPWFSSAGECKLLLGASICKSLGSGGAAGAEI